MTQPLISSTLDELIAKASFAGIAVGANAEVVAEVVGSDVAEHGCPSRLRGYRLGLYDFRDVEFHCSAEIATGAAPLAVHLIVVRPAARGVDFRGDGVFSFDGQGVFGGAPMSEMLALLGSRSAIGPAVRRIPELVVHSVGGRTNALFHYDEEETDTEPLLYQFETK